MNGMSYEKLNSLYEDMNTIVDDIVENIKSIRKTINNMDNNEHWDGNGFKAYRKKISNLTENVGEFCNNLYKINNNIKSSIDRYKQIDDQLALYTTNFRG